MSLTKTVPHRPYTGSCKAFLDGLEVGQSRIAESRKQAVAVYHTAQVFGWTLKRTKLPNGEYQLRRLK